MSDISVLIEHSIYAVATQQKRSKKSSVTMAQMRKVLFPGQYSTDTVSAQMRDLNKAVVAAIETNFIYRHSGSAKLAEVQGEFLQYAGFSADSRFCLSPKGNDFAPQMTGEQIGLDMLRAAYK